MARRCLVTGKGVLVGHNVSHANNKTKRRYLPNLQVVSLLSEALGRSVRVRISMNGMRTIEHKGGLDSWLLGTPDVKLNSRLRTFKHQVREALDKRAA